MRQRTGGEKKKIINHKVHIGHIEKDSESEI